ncbi:MAG: hypothetical protein FD126_3621, partial [Elusimicrobia bacterium]
SSKELLRTDNQKSSAFGSRRAHATTLGALLLS